MNFEFTDEKINTIYSALVEQPYKTAQPVLQSIQKQYNAAQEQPEWEADAGTPTEKV